MALKYLTGTEISVTFADETVHIVGLGFDPDDAAMLQGLTHTRGGRGTRAQEMAEAAGPGGHPRAPTRARSSTSAIPN